MTSTAAKQLEQPAPVQPVSETLEDRQTDAQVAILRGVLDAMRQPNSADAFELLKNRFSDRSLAIQIETLKSLKA